jgi:hypothetical protein
MANKPLNFPPVTLSTTLTTNIYSPPTGAGGVGAAATGQLATIRHIQIVNRTALAATFSLFKGATGANAAGTEVIGIGRSVPANSVVDWFGQMVFNADIAGGAFLVGGSGTLNALTIILEGELAVA